MSVRFHRLALLMLVLTTAIVPTGCQRASRQAQADQAPDVAMTFSVTPTPPMVGWSTVVVALADAAGQPIANATVSLKGDMSHAGMQPVLAEAEAVAPGAYQAQFGWTMAGDWFVTVTANLPDGRTAVRRFDMRVGAP